MPEDAAVAHKPAPRGFVKLPNALLDDVGLSDRALRLWALIRRRHGEGNAMIRGCWQSGFGLDATMKPHGRRAPPNGSHAGASIPWAYKAAQRELVKRGLLAVRRMGPGRPAFRWALSPDPLDGALELQALCEAGAIGEQLLQATQSRRAAYRPLDRRPIAHLVGGTPPTKQMQETQPRSREIGFSGEVGEQKGKAA